WCLCVVVVVAGVLVVAGWAEVDEVAVLPPHPATATAAASAAASVSIAVSGVLFMGRAPVVARGLGGSPYQPFAAPIAGGRALVSVETTASPQVVQAPPSESRPGAASAWLLGVCCVAQFMVILDLSIV